MGSSTQTRQEVLEELNQILAFRLFSASKNKSELLRAVVERTLDGRTEELREKPLGIHVLKRGPLFDPMEDSIVRTVATGVRKGLEAYYAGPGAADRVRIALPQGTYVAQFERLNGEPRFRRPRWQALALALILAVLSAAGLYAWRTGERRTLPKRPPYATQLTNDSGYTAHPAFSRDGRWMAFASDRGEDGQMDLWLASIEQRSEPQRFTRTPEIELTPDFSPDGRYLVYRSWKEEGGIWRKPVHGGPEQRLVNGGYRPRYSPDGTWIAYTSNDQIFAVPAAGGNPVRVSQGLRSAQCAVWTPDGSRILSLGNSPEGGADWWLSGMQGAEAASSGFRRTLEKQGFAVDTLPCPSDWLEDNVIFAWNNLIWRVKVRPGSWQISGKAEVIAGGAGMQDPRVFRHRSGEPRVAYTLEARSQRILPVPVSGAAVFPAVGGEGEGAIPTLDTSISATPDGASLAYAKWRQGRPSIWIRRMRDQKESALTSGIHFDNWPVLRQDGNEVFFARSEDAAETAIYAGDLRSGEIRLVCKSCGRPQSVTPDGAQIVSISGHALLLIDARSGKHEELFHDKTLAPKWVSLSPDGRWLAFSVQREGSVRVEGFVAPFAKRLPPKQQWTPVTAEDFDLDLHWAVDGSSLYFLQVREGFRDLWRLPLHPVSRAPAGDAARVFAFRRFQDYPVGAGRIAIGGDRVLVLVAATHGNIWAMSMPF